MKQRVLFILIFNLLTVAVKGQDGTSVLKFANKLFAETNYNQALKEYQRYLFFNHGEKNNPVYEKIADCFFSLKKYENALEYYEHAFFQYTNDSLKNEMIFRKVNCLLLTARYINSFTELFSISDTLKGYFYMKKNFYMGAAYFGMENFEEAQKCFIRSVAPAYMLQRQQIAEIFSSKRGLMSPSPVKAEMMSAIIPGSGQVYSGNLKDGINSLVLTGGFFALGCVLTVNYTFLDGLLTAGPWFQRYYAGGCKNAYLMAKQKREKKRGILYKNVLSVIASTGK
jgi:tetratricopeptide (TPR) repeat protein